MAEIDPRPEASTTDLVREAVDEARELVRLEVALAKDEVRRELDDAKKAAVMGAVAAVAALLAVAMLCVALALAIFPGPIPALVIGGIFVVGAAVFGYVAFRKVPKKPLEDTRRRLEGDARTFKEGLS